MGSSGSGAGNPAFLSQGGTPIPGLPIAGQGAPNDNPRNFGSFQNFLPDIPPAGQGPAPLARGLTAEMLQYRSPQGTVVNNSGAGSGSAGEVDSLRSQLAALQSQVNKGSGNGQFGAAGGGSAAPFDWTNGSFTPGGLTAGG
jgi:hypothetical protein